jgi:hypothetical protein
VTAATAALTLTVTAPASYTISAVAPDPISIAQGGQGPVTVTLARTNFTGTVNLTLEGAPTGVSSGFDPAAVTGTTSTLTLQVGAAVALGNHVLTVRGQATGLTDRTATFTLTVTAAASYTLTTTPGSPVSLQQGTNTNVTVNINRTAFAGSVGLALTGNPAGLTFGFNPQSTTGNTSTLTLTAAGGLAVGSYPLTITGTATGLTDRTVNLTVNVTTGGGGSGNVNLNFSGCAIDDKPVFLAFQDGPSGTWTRVTPTGDVYSFNVTQSKAGLAMVLTPVSGGTGTSVQYLSQAEITSLNAGTLCPDVPTGKTLLATTQNVGAGQVAVLSIGGGTGSANLAVPTATIEGVADGTHDLIGYARVPFAIGAGDRGYLKRDINTTAIASGGSLGTVDFTGAQSFAPATATIGLPNTLPGESVIHGMNYYLGATCEFASLYAAADGGTDPTSVTVYGLGGSLQRAMDRHQFMAFATDGGTTFRQVFETFLELTARDVTLPSVMPSFTPTALAGPYKRLRYQFTLPTDLNGSTSLTYTEEAAGKSVTITASVSGYLGGTAVDLSMPDLSGVTGWNNTWAPGSAASVDWTATGSSPAPTSLCTNGKFGFSSRGGTI